MHREVSVFDTPNSDCGDTEANACVSASQEIRLRSSLELSLTGSAESILDSITYYLDGMFPRSSLHTLRKSALSLVEILTRCKSLSPGSMTSIENLICSHLIANSSFFLYLDLDITFSFMIHVYLFLEFNTKSFVCNSSATEETSIGIIKFLNSVVSKFYDRTNLNECVLEPVESESLRRSSSFHKKRKSNSSITTSTDGSLKDVDYALAKLMDIIQFRWADLNQYLLVSKCDNIYSNCLSFSILVLSRYLSFTIQIASGQQIFQMRAPSLYQNSSFNGISTATTAESCLVSYQREVNVDIVIMLLMNALDQMEAAAVTHRSKCWVLLALVDSLCHHNNRIQLVIRPSGLVERIVRILADLLPRVREAVVDELRSAGHCSTSFISKVSDTFPELYLLTSQQDSSGTNIGGVHELDVFMAALRLLLTLSHDENDATQMLHSTQQTVVGVLLELLSSSVIWRRELQERRGTLSVDHSLSPTESAIERIVFDISLFSVNLLACYSNVENCRSVLEHDLFHTRDHALSCGTIIEQLCIWLRQETLGFIKDIVDTESAFTRERGAECKRLTDGRAERGEETAEGRRQDEAVPIAEIILGAHICLLLHSLVSLRGGRGGMTTKDSILLSAKEEAAFPHLPKRNYWLPIRILSAFVAIQGKTGVVVAESVSAVVIAIKYFESRNVQQEDISNAEVGDKKNKTLLSSSGRDVPDGGSRGSWEWDGFDFKWRPEEDRGPQIGSEDTAKCEISYAKVTENTKTTYEWLPGVAVNNRAPSILQNEQSLPECLTDPVQDVVNSPIKPQKEIIEIGENSPVSKRMNFASVILPTKAQDLPMWTSFVATNSVKRTYRSKSTFEASFQDIDDVACSGISARHRSEGLLSLTSSTDTSGKSISPPFKSKRKLVSRKSEKEDPYPEMISHLVSTKKGIFDYEDSDTD